MTDISFADKINVVVKLTEANYLYLIAIGLLLFVGLLFLTTNKKTKKESKKTFSIIYLIIIAMILIKYFASLSTMLDYLMDNVFVIFYFPNIAIYLIMIIITNIITLISIFSEKEKTPIKFINTTIFIFIHYLLVMILGVISDKNIDVFKQTAIYSNKNIHSLIELSSNIFIIWIFFLIIYKLISNYLEISKKKAPIKLKVKEINRPAEPKIIEEPVIVEEKLKWNIPFANNINRKKAPASIKRDKPRVEVKYIEKPVEKIKYVEKESELLKAIRRVNAPFMVKRDVPKTKIVYKKPTNGLLSFIEIKDAPIKINREMTKTIKVPQKVSIDNGILSLIKKKKAPLMIKREMTKKEIREKIVYKNYNNELEKYENMLTLEDYKIILAMLKERQAREKSELESKIRSPRDLMSLYFE